MSKQTRTRRIKKQRQTKFTFACPYSAEEFERKLPTVLQEYIHKTGLEIQWSKSENGFLLGLERVGHGSGYWYTATTQRTDSGCKIEGEIEFFPKNAEKEPLWKAVLYILLGIPFFLIFSVVWLLALGVNFVLDLCTKKRGNRVKRQWNLAFPPDRERILKEIMAEMGCEEVNA